MKLRHPLHLHTKSNLFAVKQKARNLMWETERVKLHLTNLFTETSWAKAWKGLWIGHSMLAWPIITFQMRSNYIECWLRMVWILSSVNTLNVKFWQCEYIIMRTITLETQLFPNSTTLKFIKMLLLLLRFYSFSKCPNNVSIWYMLLFNLESPCSYCNISYLLNRNGRDNAGLFNNKDVFLSYLSYFGLCLPLIQGISTEPFIIWWELFSPVNTQRHCCLFTTQPCCY